MSQLFIVTYILTLTVIGTETFYKTKHYSTVNSKDVAHSRKNPFVFLFNKAHEKSVNSLDLDLPEMTYTEETTREGPTLSLDSETTDDTNTCTSITEELATASTKISSASSAKGSAVNDTLRVLKLSENMFDYNGRIIYRTVNVIRHRLMKEHDQRALIESVENQLETGIKELRRIKEKCDTDSAILSRQRENAIDRLKTILDVTKQKQSLDEALSKLLLKAILP